jgi:predicted Zn-dependent peptidase
MVLGFPAPSITDARYYIAHLAAMLLGGGPISRLFQSIREERGLAYAVAADFLPYQNIGCLRVYTGTSRSRIEPVLDLVLRELHRLKTEPISPDDLRRVKKQLIGNQVIGMETSASRANALGSQLLALGHPVSLEERQARIEGVSEDQVMLLANALFDPARLVLALVGGQQAPRLTPNRLTC